MKLLTERVLIREVAQRWADQYSDAYWRKDKEMQDIGRKLRAMDAETATAADVAAIIGNDSWTRIDHCDECEVEDLPVAVTLAGNSSHPATICLSCLRKATELAAAPLPAAAPKSGETPDQRPADGDGVKLPDGAQR